MQYTKDMICDLLSKSNYSFEDLCRLVTVLRSEDGCPWDREQTNKSVRNAMIDETYEFVEGLDNDDNELMCEELGDVLFQIIFHSEIKDEQGVFNINNVIDGICKKMILRHPHVFGNTNVENSAQVLVNWETIKNDEKQRLTPYERLNSVSKALPSLMRCQKLISKAQKYGLCEKTDFDSCIEKAYNSLDEIKSTRNTDKLGELLFAICDIAHQFELEAEEILYIDNNKFVDKFKETT